MFPLPSMARKALPRVKLQTSTGGGTVSWPLGHMAPPQDRDTRQNPGPWSVVEVGRVCTERGSAHLFWVRGDPNHSVACLLGQCWVVGGPLHLKSKMLASLHVSCTLPHRLVLTPALALAHWVGARSKFMTGVH